MYIKDLYKRHDEVLPNTTLTQPHHCTVEAAKHEIERHAYLTQTRTHTLTHTKIHKHRCTHTHTHTHTPTNKFDPLVFDCHLELFIFNTQVTKLGGDIVLVATHSEEKVTCAHTHTHTHTH
jgi:hypothetical protein